jgi:ribosomal protein S18 acetylase RimI-like enzyme
MVSVRPTRPSDLEFVLALEQHPDNRSFIAQWSRAEHVLAIQRSDREHWVIERGSDGSRLGYIIVYVLIDEGLGVYIKRIVVSEKSRGIGRLALAWVVGHAFRDLGAPFVTLAVYADNERAQRSYGAIGFSRIGLSPQDRRALQSAVGGFPDDSLVMRIDRPIGQ